MGVIKEVQFELHPDITDDQTRALGVVIACLYDINNDKQSIAKAVGTADKVISVLLENPLVVRLHTLVWTLPWIGMNSKHKI